MHWVEARPYAWHHIQYDQTKSHEKIIQIERKVVIVSFEVIHDWISIHTSVPSCDSNPHIFLQEDACIHGIPWLRRVDERDVVSPQEL